MSEAGREKDFTTIGEPGELYLEGKYVAVNAEDVPLFSRICGEIHMPVFTDLRELRQFWQRIGTPVQRAVEIGDSVQLLQAIPSVGPDGESVHIVLDPRRDGDRGWLFKRILRD